MDHALQYLQPVGDQPVGPLARNVGDEPHTAAIPLVSWVIEAIVVRALAHGGAFPRLIGRRA